VVAGLIHIEAMQGVAVVINQSGGKNRGHPGPKTPLRTPPGGLVVIMTPSTGLGAKQPRPEDEAKHKGNPAIVMAETEPRHSNGGNRTPP